MDVVATLKGIKCPQCGSENFLPIGKKGAVGGEIAATFLGGAAAGVIASHSAANKTGSSVEPLNYRCLKCRNKFQSLPLVAAEEDMLAVPCTISFTRLSSFVGALIAEVIYLNGVSVGSVKNGKTITFHTSSRWNTLFVTDPYGVAFPDVYRFEAVPGGSVVVRFKRKFVK